MRRVIRTFPTSTSPVLVDTDVGQGYVKALGNPQGPHALACEYIGTRLAEWFGLSVFDYAIVELTDEDELPLSNGNLAEPGPAFISRSEKGEPWSGELKQLSLLENSDEISRLVVFDTWTLNCDRYSTHIYQEVPRIRENKRNVFLSSETDAPGKLSLRTMDHTCCFSCGRDLSPALGHLDTIQDTRLFGLFPVFRRYIERSLVQSATSDLRNVLRSEIDSMLSEVPRQWSLDAKTRSALLELIVRRAEYVADSIERKLFPDNELFPM